MNPQWVPSDRDIAEARVTDFARFAEARTGTAFPDYHTLWQWSVQDTDGFWAALWDYFDVGPRGRTVLENDAMPGARWFPDTTLNYVDQIARNARTDRPAIVYVSEDGPDRELSWGELLARTAAFADALRAVGIGPGDRVAGYLPNIPEAVIAFLGTAAVGGIWSACGQDYSAKAALDRLGQLEPKLQEAFAANTSIKFAGGVSNRDARTLAPMLGCDPALIEAQPKGAFVCSVRGLTKGAVSLAFPFGYVEQMERMDKSERNELKATMRARYAVHYTELIGETAKEEEPPDNEGDLNAGAEAIDFEHRPQAEEPSTQKNRGRTDGEREPDGGEVKRPQPRTDKDDPDRPDTAAKPDW